MATANKFQHMHTFRNYTSYNDISQPVTNVNFHNNFRLVELTILIYKHLYMSQYTYEFYDNIV
jgi:hypothetical protein